jgi:hypothetical protein
MKKIILLLSIIIFSSAAFSQGVIVIQRGSTALLETRLDSAVAHAQNGDYIYLPGGPLAGSVGTIIINKKLKIFGCGYHPDSSTATGITQILGALTLSSGSDSSFITGVYSLNGITMNVSNIYIVRCNISNIGFNSSNLTNIFISENIIRGNSNGISISGGTSNAQYPNLLVSKNIIFGSIGSSSSTVSIGGGIFSNNLIMHNTSNPVLFYISTCLFQNNIFLHATSLFSGTGVSSNTFNNNLFVADSTVLGGQSYTGNYFIESVSYIFTNYSPSSNWNPSQNFHLLGTSNGVGLGADGTDAGIYGTASPFKDGGIPINPHYQHISIPSATNSNGMLQINITVKAQNQ